MHSELGVINRRSNNVIVTGLKKSTVSDIDQVARLFRDHFSSHPTIRSTLRLGSVNKDKIQPLRVSLNNAKEVDLLLEEAKTLRSSNDLYISKNVYINKHMTRAESLAAFNQRVLRRSTKKTTDLKDHSSNARAPLNVDTRPTQDHPVDINMDESPVVENNLTGRTADVGQDQHSNRAGLNPEASIFTP